MGDLTLAVDAIARSGLARIDDFLSPLHIDALAARARARLAAGDFRPASIGRGTTSLQREDIRGDRIAWWPDEQQTPEEDDARTAFENLRQTLNVSLQLGLFEHELHYAHYPLGARYARHRDRFTGDVDDRGVRVVSTVLYLNREWRPDDGGALRLSLDDDGNEHCDVLPEGGTLVLFMSDRFVHEVLPARRDRFSLTGWFRRRP